MQTLSDPNMLLIVLGILAIIIEVAIGAALGFELLVLGVIFVAGGIIGALTGSFLGAMISIVVCILLYVFFGRKFIKKSLDITTHKTNVDLIIGKTVPVVKEIAKDEPGQVKIEGEIWRAEADHTFKIGEKVVVKSVSGVTVRVEKVTDTK